MFFIQDREVLFSFLYILGLVLPIRGGVEAVDQCLHQRLNVCLMSPFCLFDLQLLDFYRKLSTHFNAAGDEVVKVITALFIKNDQDLVNFYFTSMQVDINLHQVASLIPVQS